MRVVYDTKKEVTLTPPPPNKYKCFNAVTYFVFQESSEEVDSCWMLLTRPSPQSPGESSTTQPVENKGTQGKVKHIRVSALRVASWVKLHQTELFNCRRLEDPLNAFAVTIPGPLK